MKKDDHVVESHSNIPWLLIVFLIAITFAFFSWAYRSMPLNLFELLTDSFNKIALGVSAILAVFVGQNYVSKQEEGEKKIREYKKNYPHEKFGKDWEIVEPKSLPGAYYIFENKKNIVRHILNMKTVYDLGWHVYLNSSKKIDDKIFRSYKVGNRIRTQGDAGE